MGVDSPFTMALLAGGCAGTSVDVALFPLDSLRTRLQSSQGFWKAGGFKGVYNGVLAAALGSSPGAAIFFSTYEASKTVLKSTSGTDTWVNHSTAASLGEVGACTIRVPTNVVTQRMQVGQYKHFSEAMRSIFAEGGVRAFYVGYGTTVAREIPFSFIQFPIYERLKTFVAQYQGEQTSPTQGAACGSAAGLIAGVITTPLDVVKTRIMLEKVGDGQRKYNSTMQSMRTIFQEEGGSALFKGVGPRGGWITIGGFIFFGAYEKALQVLRNTGAWD